MADFLQTVPVIDNNKKFALVAIIAAIILLIGILMLTNKPLRTYLPDFLKEYIEDRKTNKEVITLWKSEEQINFNGLTVLETPVTKIIPCDIYTMSVEMIWYNTRIFPFKDAPYRHILHRGSHELASLNPSTAPPLSQCSLITQFGNLPPQGLPSQMNPGIFADPFTNDLIIFITTTRPNNPHEMLRIADIPLDKPFHLALVVQRNYVEVYINCRLEVTKILEREPIVVPRKDWYGLSGTANLMAQIQNLKLWKTALTSNQLRDKCPKINFNVKRPTCPGPLNQQQIAENQSINAAGSTQTLGYGTLSRCN